MGGIDAGVGCVGEGATGMDACWVVGGVGIGVGAVSFVVRRVGFGVGVGVAEDGAVGAEVFGMKYQVLYQLLVVVENLEDHL